jgi:hypothetical protein
MTKKRMQYLKTIINRYNIKDKKLKENCKKELEIYFKKEDL